MQFHSPPITLNQTTSGPAPITSAPPLIDVSDVQVVARAFVDEQSQVAINHRAVHHPYLKRLATGDFPDPVAALKDFSFQYLAYSNDFARYLTGTISSMEKREHRSALIENLTEEAGQVHEEEQAALASVGVDIDWVQGVAHPLLFLRYLDAIGLGEQFRMENDYCPEAKMWRDLFLGICRGGSGAQAVGAMGLGTESVVKFIYQPILEAIDRLVDIPPRDRVFFDLHALLDHEHGEILSDIAADFCTTPHGRHEVVRGMELALHLRACFFDAMLARAENMPVKH